MTADAPARLGWTGIAVTGAAFVTNAVGYAVPLLGARTLSTADLGALAAVLALAAIASVAGLGLQTAVAVRRARDGAVPGAVRVTAITAAVAGGISVAVVPVAAAALDVAAAPLLMVAATTVAVVWCSLPLGQLQGSQRFGTLAVGMIMLAIARYGGVVAALWWGAGVTESLAWGAVVAWLAVPPLLLLGGREAVGTTTTEGMRAREAFGTGTAALAMLAVSYADLVLARYLLTPEQAGRYAVGAVLTKGALWAPQAVTVLALPRFTHGRGRTAAVAVVASCGALLVAAATISGGLAMRLAGGASYVGLGRYAAWFAAVGALYAVAFVLVNAQIAVGARYPAAPLMVALLGLAVAATLFVPRTLPGLLAASLTTAALTLTALAVRRPRTARAPVVYPSLP